MKAKDSKVVGLNLMEARSIFSGIDNLSSLKCLALGTVTMDHETWSKVFKSISKLGSLTHLHYISGNFNPLNYIKDMSGLEVLELSRDDLTDISLLANLRNLTYLNLSNNRIGNISLLAKIPSLEYVDVSANPVYDLTPLSKLPNLQRLIISKDNKYYRMVDFLKKQNKELIVREVTPDESLVRHNYCREPEDYCVLTPNKFAYSLPRDKGYRGTFQKAKPEQRPSIFSRIFGGNKIMDFVNSAPKPKRRTYY